MAAVQFQFHGEAREMIDRAGEWARRPATADDDTLIFVARRGDSDPT